MDSHHTLRISLRILCIILAAAAAFSCQKPEPAPLTIDSEPEVIAAEGGSTTFTFTAPGQWTAVIQPASDGTEVSWLTIDPASGEAGHHTVTLTAEANPGTDARTATVTVDDGNSPATVTVLQAALSETPDNPENTNLIRSVELYMSEEDGSYYWEFKYDDQNRVTEILRDYLEDGASSGDDINIHVTYNDGSISLVYDFYDGTHRNITAETDGNRLVTGITQDSDTRTSHLQYENGYLSDIEYDINYDGYSDLSRFIWSDGNIAKLIETYFEDDSYEKRFFYTDKTIPADANLDINWLLKLGHGTFLDDGTQWLGVLGMLGERDTHYALPGYWWDPAPTGGTVDYDPDTMKDGETVIMEIVSGGDYAYGEAKYECTLTDDGALSGMTAEIPVYNITYKCTGIRKVITDEYGYSYCEIEFTTTEEISRELTDTAVYKVTVTY